MCGNDCIIIEEFENRWGKLNGTIVLVSKEIMVCMGPNHTESFQHL